MNQFFEKMCAMSNCCVNSRESRERDGSDAGPLFERRWVAVFNLSSVYLSAFALDVGGIDVSRHSHSHVLAVHFWAVQAAGERQAGS
jgi:hypothetical protein